MTRDEALKLGREIARMLAAFNGNRKAQAVVGATAQALVPVVTERGMIGEVQFLAACGIEANGRHRRIADPFKIILPPDDPAG